MDWKKVVHDVVVAVIGALVVAALSWIGVRILSFVPGVAGYLDRDMRVPLWFFALVVCLAIAGLWITSLSVWGRFKRSRPMGIEVMASDDGEAKELGSGVELAEIDLEVLRALRFADEVPLFLEDLAGALRESYPRSDIGFSLGGLVAAGYAQKEMQGNYEFAYTLTAKGAGLARERHWEVGPADALSRLRNRRRLL